MSDQPPSRPPDRTGDRGLVDSGQDVWALLVAYAKQETTEPLRGLGRWLAYGAIGSMLIATGVVLMLLALLRALQTETGTTFTGNWSWAPYLITLAAAGLVAGLSVYAVTRNRQ